MVVPRKTAKETVQQPTKWEGRTAEESDRKSAEIPKGVGVLRIDRTELMTELLNQPSLTQEWGDSLALAKGELNRLEGALKLVEAEVTIDVRHHPEDYGFSDKPSVDLIKAAVIKSNRYQQAREARDEADLEVERLKSMVYSISAKKTSLELVVQLELSGLYGDVKIPKGERETLRKEEGRRQAKDVAY